VPLFQVLLARNSEQLLGEIGCASIAFEQLVDVVFPKT
jgi:hypothetical protein